ncbi:MAG: ribonuclease HII [Thermoanaerobaculia bacterium]
MNGLFVIEEEARARGHALIAGVDEVGRGCLAGPVYAGAVIFSRRVTLSGLDDSKVLLPEVREALASRIRAAAAGAAVGAATAAEIDAIGIVAATLLAMRRALELLRRTGLVPSLVLVDAVHVPGLETAQEAYIRGDGRVAAIAAASIVAKVERDARMDELGARYPFYGFESHRGYATPEHISALRRHGPSPEHRLTFDRVLVRRGTSRAA